MDFDITIDSLFAYVGKTYVELEEAKKAIIERDLQLVQFRNRTEALEGDLQSLNEKMSVVQSQLEKAKKKGKK